MKEMHMQKMKMKMDPGKNMYHDDICDMDFATKKEYDMHMNDPDMKKYHEKVMAGKMEKW